MSKRTQSLEDLIETHNEAEMLDEIPSTDESDVDVDEFLEYTRDKIMENDLSYDSISFANFENLLKDCVADFLDNRTDDEEDSMTSESNFSGYVNEESDDGTSRRKAALLRRKGAISDNAYHRMKGIIARKKTMHITQTIRSISSKENDSNERIDIDDTTSKSFESRSEYDTSSGEDSLVELASFGSKLKISQEKSATSGLIGYESDSSDSIEIDDTLSQHSRPRRNRRKTKIKLGSRQETVKPNEAAYNRNHDIEQRISVKALHLSSEQPFYNHTSKLSNDVKSLSSFLSEDQVTNGKIHSHSHSKLPKNQGKVSTTHQSSRGKISEMCVDTTNYILPSLVKKGIQNYDTKNIEYTLARKISKTTTIDLKQQVLIELLENRPLQNHELGVARRGMASLHKLRADRKKVLQATFLRYSRQRQDESDETRSLERPNSVSDTNWKTSSPSFHDHKEFMPAVYQSPSSLSSSSSVEERNRFKMFIDKTRKSLSYSFYRHDKEGLLHNQCNEKFSESCSSSSLDGAVYVPRTSPFDKMKLSRTKESVQYEALSPASSLSNGSWSDSCDSSTNNRSVTSNIQDETQFQSSDNSEWSEMSFLSDPNRFSEFSVKSPENLKSHQRKRLPSIQSNENFDDPFDDIVFRNSPHLRCKTNLNPLGEESPTGVMDLATKSQQRREKADDALAFVDSDEGDHVFTDKEDDIYAPQAYQPVFFSPSRFEI